MVLEHAVITVRPGTNREFEVALADAQLVIAEAKGFVSLEILQGIETPNEYLLLIQWEKLDDHTIGFRQSEWFTQWRAIIGPYFESPPVVIHFSAVDGYS